MGTTLPDEIYETQVRPLPIAARLRLVELIARDLAAGTTTAPRPSLLELEGLGKHVWKGVDPDVYVRELRDEWGRRP